MSQHVARGRNHGIGEERKNFNDPETSPAGLEEWNVASTSLVLLLHLSRLTLGDGAPHPFLHISNPLCLSLISFTGNIKYLTHLLPLFCSVVFKL